MDRRIDRIIIHCSATTASMDIGADEIRQWHRARGFATIGYHYVIRRDGTIELGRPVEQAGAHARGYNDTSIGICVVGGLDDDGSITTAPALHFEHQHAALYLMIVFLRSVHNAADVMGHRDLPHARTACPCFSVRDWLATM